MRTMVTILRPPARPAGQRVGAGRSCVQPAASPLLVCCAHLLQGEYLLLEVEDTLIAYARPGSAQDWLRLSSGFPDQLSDGLLQTRPADSVSVW